VRRFRRRQSNDLSDVHEYKLHEPSADWMTGAVAKRKNKEEQQSGRCSWSANLHSHRLTHWRYWQAQSKRDSILSDVHECKHSMNHLLAYD
jgi:hypothetical protein